MGADKLAENTPNAPKLICPIVCPSPKVWDFNEKRLHWVSVVRDWKQTKFKNCKEQRVRLQNFFDPIMASNWCSLSLAGNFVFSKWKIMRLGVGSTTSIKLFLMVSLLQHPCQKWQKRLCNNFDSATDTVQFTHIKVPNFLSFLFLMRNVLLFHSTLPSYLISVEFGHFFPLCT